MLACALMFTADWEVTIPVFLFQFSGVNVGSADGGSCVNIQLKASWGSTIAKRYGHHSSSCVWLAEDSDYMEEEMTEVGVDMKNFSSIIDWDLEWLGNKEQLIEDQKLGEYDPLEVELDAFYSRDESDIEGERKQNLRKLRKEHANDGGNYVAHIWSEIPKIKMQHLARESRLSIGLLVVELIYPTRSNILLIAFNMCSAPLSSLLLFLLHVQVV
ncbi:hypothetical protein L6452_40108 [Arctium lappa]|uniref:Uncharacterized protein n=1 Tax=Arctium lappa TaxID=4217 RepID=A0ACB8XKZ7_ARCLA|nr:hypothetical protein L6452_40108 [Arctium lappa]